MSKPRPTRGVVTRVERDHDGHHLETVTMVVICDEDHAAILVELVARWAKGERLRTEMIRGLQSKRVTKALVCPPIVNRAPDRRAPSLASLMPGAKT